MCECCPLMTSRNALDPDPFDWFFDFNNSKTITVSTKGKIVLKIVIKIVSILFCGCRHFKLVSYTYNRKKGIIKLKLYREEEQKGHKTLREGANLSDLL